MEQNYPPPVYPKTDPEYRKRVMEEFYRRVKETKFYDPDEYQGKPRGRKAKVREHVETKPRTEGERRALAQQEVSNKFFKFK